MEDHGYLHTRGPHHILNVGLASQEKLWWYGFGSVISLAFDTLYRRKGKRRYVSNLFKLRSQFLSHDGEPALGGGQLRLSRGDLQLNKITTNPRFQPSGTKQRFLGFLRLIARAENLAVQIMVTFYEGETIHNVDKLLSLLRNKNDVLSPMSR